MSNPLLTEVAGIGSDPYVPQYQTVLSPTDEVLIARGGLHGLKSYDEIRRDPHAFAILQKRKLEVVSREWRVTPASDSRQDKKAAAEVERQLKGLGLDRLTKGLMGSVLKGFAVAEILWTPTATGYEAQVLVKKQRRFRFAIDGSLRLVTRANTIDGEAVPERKFIVHRHSIDDDDDDPYGVGLGSVLFWPAWFKRQALAHWLRANEKHAAPTVLGQYDGEFDKVRQDTLLAAFRQMANDTGLAVPKTVDVKLLEASNGGGGDLHEKINRYLDELMSEAVLGETLTTNSGERGARSLGEVHNDVRIAIAKADADLVCQTLRGTLVRWIVELNFPGAGIPEIWRDFSEAEDLNDRVKRDQAISGMGYKPKDVAYINETYGGDWIEKPSTVPITDKLFQSDRSKVENAAEFADQPVETRTAADVVQQLTDQMETVAAASIDAMIAAIRREFTEARDYDDLIMRLAGLSAELGIEDLAGLLDQGIQLGLLEGHAGVTVDG